MSNFLLSDQIKSMDISDFTLFKSLLMLKTWMFIFAITLSELFDLIGMITYFFERLFVIILSLGVFPVQITNDFVYFRNLVSRKLWKYIFDFYNVKDIILWYLYIKEFVQLGIFCQSLVFLEKFWLGQNTLTYPRKNR